MKKTRKGQGGALLIQVRPAERRVVAINCNISDAEIKRMLKTRLVGARELCALPGMGVVLYAREYRQPTEWFDVPRWRLGPTEPVAGFCLLFGKNASGRAASSPVTLDFVERNIAWLPSQAQERENLAAAAEGAARLTKMAAGGAAEG
jgi:hypothetical protein